jgi:hypothetical protein
MRDEELDNKFIQLLDDCKKSIEHSNKTGKGYFTDELYAIRIKEIYEIWKEKQD